MVRQHSVMEFSVDNFLLAVTFRAAIPLLFRMRGVDAHPADAAAAAH